MSRRATNLQIDPNKLNKIFDDRGLLDMDVSREAGYCDRYVTKCKNERSMSRKFVIFLKTRYGINYEDFSPDSKKTNYVS